MFVANFPKGVGQMEKASIRKKKEITQTDSVITGALRLMHDGQTTKCNSSRNVVHVFKSTFTALTLKVHHKYRYAIDLSKKVQYLLLCHVTLSYSCFFGTDCFSDIIGEFQTARKCLPTLVCDAAQQSDRDYREMTEDVYFHESCVRFKT